jgi:ribosomal peptide maturation radical SAM protein 1
VLPFAAGPGGALIIVPPFAAGDKPSLAAHVLQACAHRKGFDVRVLYANLSFARLIGEHEYTFVAESMALVGDLLFAQAAYDLAMADVTERLSTLRSVTDRKRGFSDADLDRLRRVAHSAVAWCDSLASAIASAGWAVVGCTSAFDQTAASVALLRRIKHLNPGVVTVLGGPNCEGVLAEGIAALSRDIDFVFSGESEESFPRFLEDLAHNRRPHARIVQGSECTNLDTIPRPTFTDFFRQRECCLPTSDVSLGELWLTYETSRGCWWARAHKCTFCGQQPDRLAYRTKSPDKVLSDIQHILEDSPTRRLAMVDTLMPAPYFRTLLPRIAERFRDVSLFYEQRPRLSLDEVLLLRSAGVKTIQVGIESLSSPLLERIGKGVSAGDAVALLRYCTAAGVRVGWLILYGFPGDTAAEYTQTLELLPLIHHLQPPMDVWPVTIARFSPYFEQKDRFGVDNIRPLQIYALSHPLHVDVTRLASHFSADFASDSRTSPELVGALQTGVAAWRGEWDQSRELPVLCVKRLTARCYALVDTRRVASHRTVTLLNSRQAEAALVPRQGSAPPELEWAVEHKVGIMSADAWIPFAIASVDVLREFVGSDNPRVARDDPPLKGGAHEIQAQAQCAGAAL